MNQYLVGQLADCHLRDLRQTAGAHDVRHPGASCRAAVPVSRFRPLRRRLGFAMIEAGLRLATDITDASGAAGSYLSS